jgi:hypothetical protein
MAFVPSEVKIDLLHECRETVWNPDESSGALVLERPDATLDHGEATVLTDSPEPLSDAAATAPTSELLGDELHALVGDEIPGLMAHLPEEPLQESTRPRIQGWWGRSSGRHARGRSACEQ